MSLTAKQTRLLDRLAQQATPLIGMFFRSVEFRWMHPDDVVSGEGSFKIGGRFARVGTKAVYASDSEETILREIRTRKSRLGGDLISIDRYPRITFRIDLNVDRHVSLVHPFRDKNLESLREGTLNRTNLGFSQIVGRHFEIRGVQAILYPSVTGSGTNAVVFVQNTKPSQVVIFNRAAVIAQMGK